MKVFGLIGKGISHSFSANYFNKKFAEEEIDAIYHLFDLHSIYDFEVLKERPDLAGLNVTSPYKRDVIPFLDSLSDEAEKLNAVNVIEFIKKTDGRNILMGHNTDCAGFGMTLEDVSPTQSALILGTGGASSDVALALQKKDIPYKIVSRNPSGDELDYRQCSELIPSHKIIINATPVGMHPNTDACPPIDYNRITDNHLCYDLIYNPTETLFLKKAKERGALTKNGLKMLINQAELAWEIWNKGL